MMSEQKTRRDFLALVNAIALLFMIGFGYLVPEFSTVTRTGVKVLGVFIGVLVLTIFTDRLFWAAIVGMSALVFHGYLSGSQALSTWLASNTLVQFIFITALCGALRESGAMNVIARYFLTWRLLKGRPFLIVFVFLVTTYLISMLLGFAPTAVLMFSFFESIRDEAGYDKKDRFCKHMLLGIYIACQGAYALPFIGIQTIGISMIKSTLAQYGLVWSDMVYFVTNVVVYTAFLLIYVLSMPRLFKCNLERLRTVELSEVKALRSVSTKLDKKQSIILATFGVCMAYVILIGLLPKNVAGYEQISRIGTPWIWALGLAFLSVIRVDGKFLADGQQLLRNHTMWNIVCLVGIFTMLGNAVASKDLGIASWISSVVSSLFADVGFPILMTLTVVVVTVATQFANGLPLVLAGVAVVMPFTAQLAIETGINPSVMGTTINLCANMAYLTYAGSVFASLLLGRDEIDQKWVWTKGVAVLAMYIVTCAVLSIALSYVL